MSLGPPDLRLNGVITSSAPAAVALPAGPSPLRLSSADAQTLSTLDPAQKVKAASLPLERLASNPNLSEAEKVAEVSRQFEAILLRQILTEAGKTTFKSTWNAPSVSKDIYQDMISSQLADSISQAGTFGLARSFQHQLTRQVGAAPPTESNPSDEVPVSSLHPLAPAKPGIISTRH
jgi:peptidoglycan hydrolase FlgJ